jgi:cyclopropane-fatty-acyl-phospholipid synthase
MEKHNLYIPLDLFMLDNNKKYYENNGTILNDFVTSPEITQEFGYTCAEYIFNKMSNKQIILIEMGPGRGLLMRDILHFAHQNNYLGCIQKVILLENSQYLKNIQQQVLNGYHNNLEWIDDINRIENLDNPVFISNEFFDALPIKQFIKRNDCFFEIYVQNRNFTLDNTPIAMEQMQKIMRWSNIDEYKEFYEISIIGLQLWNKIMQYVKKYHGYALTIDYGYLSSQGKNTFKTIKEHAISENLSYQYSDMSAEVDFGALQNIAKHFNLNTNFMTQKVFLHSINNIFVQNMENFLVLEVYSG